jgi:hypothetical protein
VRVRVRVRVRCGCVRARAHEVGKQQPSTPSANTKKKRTQEGHRRSWKTQKKK